MLNKKEWPLALIKKLFYCICNGIGACRHEGLEHCDIKPDNILISIRLVPKISDFGLAFTDTESIKGFRGTRSFAAPELFKIRPFDSSVNYELAD